MYVHSIYKPQFIDDFVSNIVANKRVRKLARRIINCRISKFNPSRPYLLFLRVKMNTVAIKPIILGIYVTMFLVLP
ncbi:hypothetical protein CN373_04895 [Bacillus cereus]|nr:hypothetical protein CN373_04895 [Bacillus cereus]PFN09556.1 hypothetical protein COJ55_02400 [Bacillus cereus]PFO81464.1 hypothetical protein COJ77_15605 [Bacillus cereus]